MTIRERAKKVMSKWKEMNKLLSSDRLPPGSNLEMIFEQWIVEEFREISGAPDQDPDSPIFISANPDITDEELIFSERQITEWMYLPRGIPLQNIDNVVVGERFKALMESYCKKYSKATVLEALELLSKRNPSKDGWIDAGVGGEILENILEELKTKGH